MNKSFFLKMIYSTKPLAIEQSTATNITPLLQLLRQYSGIDQTQTELLQEHCIDDTSTITFILDRKILKIATNKHTILSLAKEPSVENGDSYLTYAERIYPSNLIAARYYNLRARRFYINSGDTQGILATKEFTNKIDNSINKIYAGPRKIINLSPNETARLSSKNTNTDLFVKLLFPRLAVAFKDKKGNISLTHIDASSSLDFIFTEALTMQGEYTIDIIKNSEHDANSYPTLAVLNACINGTLGNIRNSKGTTEVRNTKTGTLLITPEKLLTPKIEDIYQLLPGSLKLQRPISNTNPFKDHQFEDGDKPSQLRIFERILLALVDTNKTSPTLVFNDSWTGNFPTLPEKTAAIFAKAKSLQGTEQDNYLFNAVKKTFPSTVSEKDLALIKRTPALLNAYADYQAKDLYSNLSLFFKNNNKSMPDKILGLMTQYTEKYSSNAVTSKSKP